MHDDVTADIMCHLGRELMGKETREGVEEGIKEG
jgi:hypothetical protein